ncbi:putative reverse transcriptase domain-containing protein [Tanacetum coccineum]
MASFYEREAAISRQVWAHSESRSQAIEAHRALQRDVDVLQRQRIRDEDRPTSHIQHDHDRFRELVCTTDAGPQDGPADDIKQTKAEMEMTVIIQELVAEGQSELLKMESVFHISNCTVAFQIKFATCTLLGNALTWWNSYVKTVGHDAAYSMPWKTLKNMMTDKIFLEESDEVEKYVGGFPDMIQGSVMASKPKTMQDAIDVALSHHCQREHASARDCRSPAAANNQRALGENQRVVTCVECGVQGYFKRDCPKLKNNNRGNQDGNGRATARAYVVGNAGKNPDSNVV